MRGISAHWQMMLESIKNAAYAGATLATNSLKSFHACKRRKLQAETNRLVWLSNVNTQLAATSAPAS
jgi:hypothetical protein